MLTDRPTSGLAFKGTGRKNTFIVDGNEKMSMILEKQRSPKYMKK